MNVGEKVKQMKADLVKVVSICNEAEDFNLAQQAQSALTSIASCSTQFETSGAKTAKLDFK